MTDRNDDMKTKDLDSNKTTKVEAVDEQGEGGNDVQTKQTHLATGFPMIASPIDAVPFIEPKAKLDTRGNGKDARKEGTVIGTEGPIQPHAETLTEAAHRRGEGVDPTPKI